jgi:hypothetical protein
MSVRFAALLLAAAGPAAAQQFTVGADAACSTSSLQAALDAASDGYTIRVARNQAYAAQALRIDGKDLHLVGGYDNCSSPSPAGLTTISGLGGGADSVLTVRGQVDLVLENLNLVRGDEVSDGYGGGLDVSGRGTVTLRNTTLVQNYAGYGGGISAISDGGSLALRLETGTVIQLNIAQYSGGGIRAEGSVTVTAVDPQTWIASNEARGIDPGNQQPRFGNGGGVQLLAPARALIGSPGYGNSGVIFGNTARYGGGVAIDGRTDGGDLSTARLDLFTTDPANPTRIHGNRATQTGGGIHLLPDAVGFFPFPRSFARACIWDARIEDNIAQEGAAIYADTNFAAANRTSSTVHFNPQPGDPDSIFGGGCGARPAGAASCPPGPDCNTLAYNLAQVADLQPSGAAVLTQDGGVVVLRRVSMAGNYGTGLLRATSEATVHLHDVLATGGSYTGVAMRIDSSLPTVVEGTTIAGNFIGAGQVITTQGPIEFKRNLAWQPGRRVLAAGGAIDLATSIVSDLAGMPPGPEALVLEPRFVDPAQNDFSLRAASPAVDFAPAVAGNDLDRDGRPRDVDLPLKANARGPRDVGALERPTLAPLVLNAGFDGFATHWREVTAGASSHDPTQDAGGNTASGSIAVNSTALVAGRVAARAQCIHLPGPGRYLLNGSGRTVGSLGATRDLVVLNWAFRSDGGEGCESGAAVRSGDLALSSSTAWQRAATPAEIVVDAAEWTVDSSITVTLVVVDRGVSGTPTAVGWFDDIVLDAGTPTTTDPLFSDGFE